MTWPHAFRGVAIGVIANRVSDDFTESLVVVLLLTAAFFLTDWIHDEY